jgi:hypothetical protein
MASYHGKDDDCFSVWGMGATTFQRHAGVLLCHW